MYKQAICDFAVGVCGFVLTCECCCVFLGKVILASTKAVYVLVPLPLERQIQDLLASHRVEEALILTEGAQRNIPKDKFQVRNSVSFRLSLITDSMLTNPGGRSSMKTITLS